MREGTEAAAAGAGIDAPEARSTILSIFISVCNSNNNKCQDEARRRPGRGQEVPGEGVEEATNRRRKWRPAGGKQKARRRPERDQEETTNIRRNKRKRRPGEGQEEARRRPGRGQKEARKRPGGGQEEERRRPGGGQNASRRRPGCVQEEAKRRARRGALEGAGAGQGEVSAGGASAVAAAATAAGHCVVSWWLRGAACGRAMEGVGTHKHGAKIIRNSFVRERTFA